MAHLTRPVVISGVSAGSFPEKAAVNRAYLLFIEEIQMNNTVGIICSNMQNFKANDSIKV